MYLEILLTLNLIVTITISILILVWWFKKGKKIFKQFSDLKKTGGIPKNLINPTDMNKILESFDFFKKK